ncbi:hypothetical protein HNE_1004 [Hyphomonas neptunium ATCC 15444]|uniref:Uncharacterized protein n=3 Tax=Hyphomonadaceae TaxID=69657 RepID=Q0C3G6_HYPNA|nr:hypothetical protein HNE_1004 [Hyphomonas neptunium ATCC 15444]KCZ96064.1 hypothetical protein HHI_00255 [Hyphomonas hirschiana VP5]
MVGRGGQSVIDRIMKTLKIELAIAGAALFALGAFMATRPQEAEAVQTSGLTQFTQADYAAFNRNFEMDGATCKVGLERDRICFGGSPVEGILMPGMTLPADVPMVGAEFRVILFTELKSESLRTVRFGRSLALVEPQSRYVQDVLDLSAPTFEKARKTAVN